MWRLLSASRQPYHAFYGRRDASHAAQPDSPTRSSTSNETGNCCMKPLMRPFARKLARSEGSRWMSGAERARDAAGQVDPAEGQKSERQVPGDPPQQTGERRAASSACPSRFVDRPGEDFRCAAGSRGNAGTPAAPGIEFVRPAAGKRPFHRGPRAPLREEALQGRVRPAPPRAASCARIRRRDNDRFPVTGSKTSADALNPVPAPSTSRVARSPPGLPACRVTVSSAPRAKGRSRAPRNH